MEIKEFDGRCFRESYTFDGKYFFYPFHGSCHDYGCGIGIKGDLPKNGDGKKHSIYGSNKYGNRYYYDLYGGNWYKEIRKITFKDKDIIIEVRDYYNKNFKKKILKDITNKEFYEHVRNNVEVIYGDGHMYHITPNKNRTVFKFTWNDDFKDYYYKDRNLYVLQNDGKYKEIKKGD